MRRSKGFITFATTGLLCGLAMTTTTAASDAGRTVDRASLTADKASIRAGSTLTMHLNHGGESISWISSPAFVRNGAHPTGANEGLARVVTDRAGNAEAVATIDNVPPGSYTVHTRVGGGSGPVMSITVIR
jgi:hypothetical protein